MNNWIYTIQPVIYSSCDSPIISLFCLSIWLWSNLINPLFFTFYMHIMRYHALCAVKYVSNLTNSSDERSNHYWVLLYYSNLWMIRRMSLGKIISMLIFCKEMTFTDTIIWSNNYIGYYIFYMVPYPILSKKK
jgi:hypothetical protein